MLSIATWTLRGSLKYLCLKEWMCDHGRPLYRIYLAKHFTFSSPHIFEVDSMFPIIFHHTESPSQILHNQWSFWIFVTHISSALLVLTTHHSMAFLILAICPSLCLVFIFFYSITCPPDSGLYTWCGPNVCFIFSVNCPDFLLWL